MRLAQVLTVRDLQGGTDSKPLLKKTKSHGLPITIEHQRGSRRTLHDDKGNVVYDVKLHHDYGYIGNTKGRDGDEVDCFIGPKTDAEEIFVVHMIDKGPVKKAREDEDKCFIGFPNAATAKTAFLLHYPESFFGGMTIFPVKMFHKKLREAQKPYHSKKLHAEGKISTQASDEKGNHCQISVQSRQERQSVRLLELERRIEGEGLRPIQSDELGNGAKRERTQGLVHSVYRPDTKGQMDSAHVRQHAVRESDAFVSGNGAKQRGRHDRQRPSRYSSESFASDSAKAKNRQITLSGSEATEGCSGNNGHQSGTRLAVTGTESAITEGSVRSVLDRLVQSAKLAQKKQARLHAGGPGSGRHPEHGAMQKTLVEKGYKNHPGPTDTENYIHPESHDYITLKPNGNWHRKDQPEESRGTGVDSLNKHFGGAHRIAAGAKKCPHCGSKRFGLMPTDFETAKCSDCGRNFEINAGGK